jgi:hypothetical protein
VVNADRRGALKALHERFSNVRIGEGRAAWTIQAAGANAASRKISTRGRMAARFFAPLAMYIRIETKITSTIAGTYLVISQMFNDE